MLPLETYLRRIEVQVELGTESHAPSSSPMSNTASEIGTCPFCKSVVLAGAALIEYEVEDEIRLFAECYECEEPVQPQ